MSQNAFTLTGTLRPVAPVQREIVTLGDSFALLTPLFLVIEFHFAGLVMASDLIMLAVFPLALIRHVDRLKQRPVPTVLVLGALWLVAQVFTDVVRGAGPDDYLRGWVKIIFVLINFTVVWTVVCVSRRRFVLYGIGLALGTILEAMMHPSVDALSSPWKFGIGIPVTMLVALFAAKLRNLRYLGVLLPLGSLAVVHLYKDFRIMGVICFVVVIYTIFLSSANSKRNSGTRRALLVFSLIAGIAAFSTAYSHFAKQGVFGKYAQDKLEVQSAGEGGTLLGGRREILGSGPAIWDSPIIGHGSWARDSQYGAIMRERTADLGYKRFQDGGAAKDDLIPTHSYVFGSWVEAGIVGAIFWMFFLIYTAYTLFSASGDEPLLPFFAFVALMLMWDILFSPLGTPTRFIAPFFMVTIILFRRFQTGLPEPGWQTE
jgi:hypothetical protein